MNTRVLSQIVGFCLLCWANYGHNVDTCGYAVKYHQRSMADYEFRLSSSQIRQTTLKLQFHQFSQSFNSPNSSGLPNTQFPITLPIHRSPAANCLHDTIYNFNPRPTKPSNGSLKLPISIYMSRKRFLESVVATSAPKYASRALPPTLPLCLPHITNSHRKIAKALSNKARRQLKQTDNTPLVGYSPKEVEELMFLNICARNYDQVWGIAKMIKEDPIALRYRTPSIYLLLLLLISSQGDTGHAMLALSLYAELYNGRSKLLNEEHDLAANLLFSILRKCSDFTLMLPLKSVYESIMVHHLECENQYIAVSLDILMNSRQYIKALDLFETYMMALDEREIGDALTLLPVLKLFNYMCSVQDLDSLVKWLPTVTGREQEIVTASDWSSYLGLALSLNNYALVNFIYVNWIMAGLDTHLSAEDVVLNNNISRLQALNTIFQTLSDQTLHQILHTLASHGDVELTLNLIEWHYIHKSLKGERALTKELCVDVIRSYCFYDDPDSQGQDRDHSMEKVLDVLDSFVTRSKADFVLSFKDISDAISHKIHNYKAEDSNVNEANRKLMGTLEFIEASNEENTLSVTELPRKTTNSNILDSAHGNPVLNTEVLRLFVESHMDYLLRKSANATTIVLFVNCIMNHLNKYQNCSGLIVALRTLKSMNQDFVNEWLDNDLFDILIRSITTSPAARLTGLELYQYMKINQWTIAQRQMIHFIFSSLRDQNYQTLFEYYVYEYLMLSPTKVSTHLLKRIANFSHLDHRGRVVLEVLELEKVPKIDEIESFWESNGLNKTPNVNIYDEESIYSKIDARDRQLLKHILT